nr:PREDICTED: uncharacterized protein LOC109039509 [Bemisia tabaci]
MADDSDMLNCSDSLLTNKLLQEDPDQFYTLVRMHLSFVLDLNTDDCDGPNEKTKFKPLKWNFLSKKPKGSLKGVIEKVTLTEAGMTQIAQLIEFLSKMENISQEGIFRLTGALSRQNKLKSLISQGLPLNLEDGQFSVHDCASVLKNFLSELPEPLLSDTYYPAYIQISELCTLGDSAKNRLLRSLQLLLMLLPARNRAFFKDIIKLLNLTASHEKTNKMSPENLATLFTPHLLCPRKLTPEALHMNAQKLSKVLVFMIQAGLDLFEVPPTLATDIRAYWADKNRKILSEKTGAEMVRETSAVNTVFSFVDRARTAEENTLNPTEAALAQLYAHIQSLPESSKKRRLVKQFNKENGHGTPRQFSGGKSSQKSKGFGDSIKKHILNKNGKHMVKIDYASKADKTSEDISSSECLSPNSPQHCLKSPLRENDCQNKENESDQPMKHLRFKEGAMEKIIEVSKERQSCERDTEEVNSDLTISSIDKQTEDEYFSTKSVYATTSANGAYCSSEFPERSHGHLQCPDALRTQFFSPSVRLHRKSAAKTFNFTPSGSCYALSNKFNNYTSTPACRTPSPLINDDMSPITLSAQKMTKAMQETMMTPRCRKPVIAISDSNLSNLTDLPWSPGQNSAESLKGGSKKEKNGSNRNSDTSNDSQKLGSNSDTKKDGLSNPVDFNDSHLLTDTFCDYLYSRSLLTASPVDLSFSSRTGDFEHSSSNTLSMSDGVSLMDDDDKSVIFSDEEKLSSSLLYFLDGNEPPSDSSSLSSRKRSASDSGLFSPSECLKKSPRHAAPKANCKKETSL